MSETKAYAALAGKGPLVPHTITRRAPGANDVAIEILFSGICHTDIHQVNEEWGPAKFPMVPGHEIVGRVVSVGANVKDLAAGMAVGVGCMVDSCRTCANCNDSSEQDCGATVYTYNDTFKHDHVAEKVSSPSSLSASSSQVLSTYRAAPLTAATVVPSLSIVISWSRCLRALRK